MIIEIFETGPFATNAMVIGCAKTLKGVLIDPALGSYSLIQAACQKKNLNLEAIWLTHSHLDHIAEVDLWDLPIYVHPADEANLEKPGTDGLPLFFPVKGAKATGQFHEGQILKIGQLEALVMHTPGHSPGSVCFYFENEDILISGDTLFRHSIGNLSFPTSNTRDMERSLAKLATLPSSVIVYPGHGESTTIREERHFYLGGL